MTRSILFFRETLWKDTNRVSTNIIAEHFHEAGWRVGWISLFNHIKSFLSSDPRSKERMRLWRAGGETDDGVFCYAPFVSLPYSSRPPFRSLWIGRNHLRFTLPSLRKILEREGFLPADVLWVASSFAASALPLLPGTRKVVQIADNHAGLPHAPRTVVDLEGWMIEQSDDLIVTAHTLRDIIADRHGLGEEAIEVLPHGVRMDEYEPEAPVPDDLERIPHPRAVYVGALWKVDMPLLSSLAMGMTDVQFILIGGTWGLRGMESEIPRLPNVHLLGPVPHETLPAYLKGCDVGLIPYRSKEWPDLFRGVHPMKVYEYAAAGIPTVGTPLEEYARAGLPVKTGETAEVISQRIREALGQPDREALRDFARDHTWSRRFQKVLEVLDG